MDASSNNQRFFHGYNNPYVIILLILNSFVGIAITAIYKYGDAVLKTLTGPLSSAILVYLSYAFFDMSLDLVKAAGAAVVVVDTLLYLSLPSAPPKQEPTESSASPRRNAASKYKMRLILLLFVVAGSQLVSYIQNTGFSMYETLNTTTVSPKNSTVEVDQDISDQGNSKPASPRLRSKIQH